jgi:hypothetical protein
MSLKSDNVEFVRIVAAILKMATLAVTIFKNGCHNTAQIQHCPISTTFHMWVDYDVPNLFPTLKNMESPKSATDNRFIE